MPVDTARKRFSLIGLDLPSGKLLPIPDGTLEDNDWQSLLGKYYGIDFNPPTALSNMRFCWIALDLPFGGVLPVPKGSFNANDRQQLLHKYCEILFSTGAVAVRHRLLLLGVGR